MSEVTFAAYMEHALYGPDGYYSSGRAQSGRQGDYFTAPDVGPVFGRLLAEIFLQWQAKLGEPFALIEAGAGEGRLARDILQAHPFRYIAIEKSPARQKWLQGLEVYPDLKAVSGLQGVLFGNELIDAFPVHRVRVRNGELEEAYVGADRESAPTLTWGPPSTTRLQSYFSRLNIQLPEGYETEVNLAMADWLKEATRALTRGLVVLCDYGRPAHGYFAPERAGGTLRGFSKHHVGVAARDGDITADVDFTSLALDAMECGLLPLAYMGLGSFLMQGAERLLKRISSEEIDPTLLRGLRYLVHPEGMGDAFQVLILGKGIATQEWNFENNRLARLGLSEGEKAC